MNAEDFGDMYSSKNKRGGSASQRGALDRQMKNVKSTLNKHKGDMNANLANIES